MMIKNVKKRIGECVTVFEFDYKGVHGGVDPFSSTNFDMWYGDTNITVHSIDEVMNQKLFDGNSLSEIIDLIENVDGL